VIRAKHARHNGYTWTALRGRRLSISVDCQSISRSAAHRSQHVHDCTSTIHLPRPFTCIACRFAAPFHAGAMAPKDLLRGSSPYLFKACCRLLAIPLAEHKVFIHMAALNNALQCRLHFSANLAILGPQCAGPIHSRSQGTWGDPEPLPLCSIAFLYVSTQPHIWLRPHLFGGNSQAQVSQQGRRPTHAVALLLLTHEHLKCLPVRGLGLFLGGNQRGCAPSPSGASRLHRPMLTCPTFPSDAGGGVAPQAIL
jgi:hypothetical protein